MKYTKRDVFLYYADMLDADTCLELESAARREGQVRQWMEELDPGFENDDVVVEEALALARSIDPLSQSREAANFFKEMERQDRIRSLVRLWQCGTDWLKSMRASAADLQALITQGILDATCLVPSVAFQGTCEQPKSAPIDPDLPDADEYEEVTPSGIYRMSCLKEKAPFGFGLIYIFDKSQDNRLVALEPVILGEAAKTYSVEIDLRQWQLDEIEREYTARIVAASEQTTCLFTEAMLTELSEISGNAKQRAMIDDFRSVWKKQEASHGHE